MHFDSPWFWGADRMNMPVWLLVVMHRSGLFRAETVAQIQGVAYVHDWGSKVGDVTIIAILFTWEARRRVHTLPFVTHWGGGGGGWGWEAVSAFRRLTTALRRRII